MTPPPNALDLEALIGTWRAKAASFRAGRDVINMDTEVLVLEDCADELDPIARSLAEARGKAEAELSHERKTTEDALRRTADYAVRAEAAESRATQLAQELADAVDRAGTWEVSYEVANTERDEARAERDEAQQHVTEAMSSRDGWKELATKLSSHLATATAREAAVMATLKAIRGWDMLDATADGPHWKRTIDAALDASPDPETRTP